MSFGTWATFAERHRRWMILLALVSAFAGVGLIIDRPKGSILAWFSAPLLVIGGSVFAYVVWPRPTGEAHVRKSLAGRFLHFVTFRGRLRPAFPAIGMATILADLAYNLLLSATPALQTEDTIVLLGAASLLGYGFVPKRFGTERDFVFVFFIALNAILVFPLLVARAFYSDFEHSVDVYSWIALAPQTSTFLNILGVANTLHSVPGFTAPGLTFRPQHLPLPVTVVITTSCSGIYSFGIFASAFIAFVATEYEHLTRRVWAILGLGLLTAYAANVLRMVVIVLIGYYTDTPTSDLQNMLIAHSYAGWLIFLGWLTLFWGLIFNWMPRLTNSTPSEVASTPNRVRSSCSICSGSLTPLLPAAQCTCGAYYHKACLASAGLCRMCGHTVLPNTPSPAK